jgi:hypothetical protein
MIVIRMGKFRNLRISRPTNLELVALALVLFFLLIALHLWK